MITAKTQSKSNGLVLRCGLSLVLSITISGCMIDMGLPEPIAYDSPPTEIMDLSVAQSDTGDMTTMNNADAIVVDASSQPDQEFSTDADTFDASPDAARPSDADILDASLPIDAMVQDSMVPIDPCRQPVIDTGYQLLGFSYAIIEGITASNTGCIPAIHTDFLPSIQGPPRIRWTGEVIADQEGYQLNISIPNLDGTGCTQVLDWGGSRLGGIENITLGIPVGQTPFVFELSCSGSPPSFGVSFGP